jgi:hypothetical protein
MQQVILEASSDLENVPRHTEALMFSIYLVAVTSLTDQECETMLNESRTDLLTRYSHAIQQALANARFLKSLSLSTLQALCIYLVSCLSCSCVQYAILSPLILQPPIIYTTSCSNCLSFLFEER